MGEDAERVEKTLWSELPLCAYVTDPEVVQTDVEGMCLESNGDFVPEASEKDSLDYSSFVWLCGLKDQIPEGAHRAVGIVRCHTGARSLPMLGDSLNLSVAWPLPRDELQPCPLTSISLTCARDGCVWIPK